MAYNLGMPVYVMMEEMPYVEFKKWVEFFRRRPVGWREDFRAAMIMKSFGFKGNPEDVFVSLRQIKKHEEDKKINDRAVPKGLFLNKMLSAVGGDNSGWKPETKGQSNGKTNSES